MKVDEMVQGTRDALRAQIVYGEPIERNGTVVVPAAKVTGGGGGGGDNENNGGAGFGLRARPAGAWVIRGDSVTWQPAIDVNRAVLGGQIVAIVALLALRSIFRRRS
jgi:uncharacterized spore protein YtfJ